jgi:hypothetical protein
VLGIRDPALLVDEILHIPEAGGVLDQGPQGQHAPLEDLHAGPEHNVLAELAGASRRRELRFDLLEARHENAVYQESPDLG